MKKTANRLALLLFGLCAMMPAFAQAQTDGQIYIAGIAEPRGVALPRGARFGACYTSVTTPAVYETVTHVAMQSTADGPRPVRRKVTREVTPRRVAWVRLVCPHLLTEEFTKTLQRALSMRGQYFGPIDGAYGPGTREAVAIYQAGRGVKTDLLAHDVAQALGLLPHDDFEALRQKE